MRILPLIAVAVVTASSLPVVALPAVVLAAPQQQVATQAAPTEAEIEAAAETFGAVLEALDAQAAPIRNDASLTPEQRRARITALITPHQAEIDAFLDLLARFAEGKAISEGTPADEARAQAAFVRQLLPQVLVNALVEGRGQEI